MVYFHDKYALMDKETIFSRFLSGFELFQFCKNGRTFLHNLSCEKKREIIACVFVPFS